MEADPWGAVCTIALIYIVSSVKPIGLDLEELSSYQCSHELGFFSPLLLILDLTEFTTVQETRFYCLWKHHVNQYLGYWTTTLETRNLCCAVQTQFRASVFLGVLFELQIFEARSVSQHLCIYTLDVLRGLWEWISM